MVVGQLSRVPDENVTFAWDIAPLPAGPAGTVDVVGQAAFVVFRNSPNPEATVDFLKFLTNKANTLRIAQFFPPIRASVLETDVLVNANPRVSAESMQTAVIAPTLTGRVLPAHPNFPTIDLTSRPYFDQMWVADADIPAIANQLCEAIQPLLSQ
jgi:multiple sugar transport system substrate-binding protein